MNPRPRTTISVRRNDRPAWLPFGSGKLYIDGNYVGSLVGGKPRTLYVLPGEHYVGVGIGMATPVSVRVELPIGERVDLECRAVRGCTGDWSRKHWWYSVLSALALGVLALMLPLPFLVASGWLDFNRRWIYQIYLLFQGIIYWIVYYSPIFDPLVVMTKDIYVLLGVIYLGCTLGSAICAVFAARFLLRRFGRTMSLKVVETQQSPATDPLALNANETAEPLTNACVLAGLKARASRPVGSGSRWDRLESDAATVDDQ